MTDERGTAGGGWKEYRPTKTVWFWSCAGTAVATMILGFTWGGWVTGGSAANSIAQANTAARAELAAAICVDRFISAPDARVQHATLMEQSRWNRDSMIAKGGWTTLAGMSEPIAGAAALCAKQLAETELPLVEEAVLEVEPG